MTGALFAAIVLAQVGIGIDRPPATAPAAAHTPHARRTHRPEPAPTPLPSAREATQAPAPAATPTSAPHRAPAGNQCAHAADVAIDSATQEKTDSSGGSDNFVIHVSILNRGSANQGGHVKQLISVYRNEERIARMQIPSLEAGEAYAFTTKFKRSSDAGRNSTTLLFRLGGENYAPRSIEDCNDRNNSFRLTF